MLISPELSKLLQSLRTHISVYTSLRGFNSLIPLATILVTNLFLKNFFLCILGFENYSLNAIFTNASLEVLTIVIFNANFLVIGFFVDLFDESRLYGGKSGRLFKFFLDLINATKYFNHFQKYGKLHSKELFQLGNVHSFLFIFCLNNYFLNCATSNAQVLAMIMDSSRRERNIMKFKQRARCVFIAMIFYNLNYNIEYTRLIFNEILAEVVYFIVLFTILRYV